MNMKKNTEEKRINRVIPFVLSGAMILSFTAHAAEISCPPDDNTGTEETCFLEYQGPGPDSFIPEAAVVNETGYVEETEYQESELPLPEADYIEDGSESGSVEIPDQTYAGEETPGMENPGKRNETREPQFGDTGEESRMPDTMESGTEEETPGRNPGSVTEADSSDPSADKTDPSESNSPAAGQDETECHPEKSSPSEISHSDSPDTETDDSAAETKPDNPQEDETGNDAEDTAKITETSTDISSETESESSSEEESEGQSEAKVENPVTALPEETAPVSPEKETSSETENPSGKEKESESSPGPAFEKETGAITETEDAESDPAKPEETGTDFTEVMGPGATDEREGLPDEETNQQTGMGYSENTGSTNTVYYGNRYGGFHSGTFRYKKSLTREQRLENLRVGFHRSTGENSALCDAENWVDVHMGRGTNTEVVGKLYPGDLCYILADSDDPWVYIESGNVRGFVFSYYLTSGTKADDRIRAEGSGGMQFAEEVLDPLQNEAFRYSLLTKGSITTTPHRETEVITDGVSEERASLLNLAASFEGTSYEWGGSDPHTGFDCSGFVQYVYSRFGVNLPRTAEEQAYAGTKIAVEDAMPGDLVFMMDSTGYIYHVVLYAGEGKTLEAKGSAYGVGSFDLDYGSACWAVRLINDGGLNVSTGRIDGMGYTQEQLELIWAIVAQEDNGSYEGALAVITSAMNRADENYGGFGQNALAQLTAPGQYCFSPSVSDPGYYQARLGGNVPDYVKEAVSDCLIYGDRNHGFLNFRSNSGSGGRTQIGGNWFF